MASAPNTSWSSLSPVPIRLLSAGRGSLESGNLLPPSASERPVHNLWLLLRSASFPLWFESGFAHTSSQLLVELPDQASGTGTNRRTSQSSFHAALLIAARRIAVSLAPVGQAMMRSVSMRCRISSTKGFHVVSAAYRTSPPK